ncbi:MAG: alanine dehydrogenase [Firmicutes bacterium]|nr:alanine dehydrogenase [Bacillota bacterium]
MIVGVPKEIKANEGRVAVTAAGVQALTSSGHQVLVQTGAGLASGISDKDYQEVGAELIDSPAEIFQRADMIVKVKEPLASEYELMREGQIVFTYLHLAREPELTEVLLKRKVTSVAYETIQLDNGTVPLLTPMSEVAGRMAVQVGARFLEIPNGGRGVLMGGVPGVESAHVVIIGAGVVGTSALKIAVGMGARVTVLDKNLERLRYLDDIYGGRISTLASNPYNVDQAAADADLLVGAVLVVGAKAPRLVSEATVMKMKPGSVIVDVAIDQGGSIETIDRVTTHAEPTYVKHGVVHYAVANMPGAVARTSTFALTNATLPYVLQLANLGFHQAIAQDCALALGVNTYRGKLTCRAVGEAFNIGTCELIEALKG